MWQYFKTVSLFIYLPDLLHSFMYPWPFLHPSIINGTIHRWTWPTDVCARVGYRWMLLTISHFNQHVWPFKSHYDKQISYESWWPSVRPRDVSTWPPPHPPTPVLLAYTNRHRGNPRAGRGRSNTTAMYVTTGKKTDGEICENVCHRFLFFLFHFLWMDPAHVLLKPMTKIIIIGLTSIISFIAKASTWGIVK